jgi:hypothetical protein
MIDIKINVHGRGKYIGPAGSHRLTKNDGHSAFICPACCQEHKIPDANANYGTDSCPTFMTNVRIVTGSSICHFYITKGSIEYLPDCTHHLKSKTVKYFY